MNRKNYIDKSIFIIKQNEYYLAFLCLTAWFNFLQLGFIVINSNVFLIPLLIYSLFREILFFVLFIKENNRHNFFISLIAYILSLIGILPFKAEKELKKFNQIIFRAPRFLYFWYVIASILQLLRTRSYVKHALIQILIFYIIIINISRLTNFNDKKDVFESIKNEIDLCLKTIFFVSIFTGIVQLLMIIFNYQTVFGGTAIGIYGKGLVGIMGNPNSVGITSGVAMIASIHIIQKDQTIWQKVLAYSNLFIHCITLVFCNSRTSLLAVIFGFTVVFIFVLFEKKNRQIQFILFLSIKKVKNRVNPIFFTFYLIHI